MAGRKEVNDSLSHASVNLSRGLVRFRWLSLWMQSPKLCGLLDGLGQFNSCVTLRQMWIVHHSVQDDHIVLNSKSIVSLSSVHYCQAFSIEESYELIKGCVFTDSNKHADWPFEVIG